jgi:hypothetical protein
VIIEIFFSELFKEVGSPADRIVKMKRLLGELPLHDTVFSHSVIVETFIRIYRTFAAIKHLRSKEHIFIKTSGFESKSVIFDKPSSVQLIPYNSLDHIIAIHMIKDLLTAFHIYMRRLGAPLRRILSGESTTRKISIILQDQIMQSLKISFMEHIITVQKTEKFTLRCIHASVTSHGQASVLGGDCTKSRIPFAKGVADFQGTVRRSVIDKNSFEILIRLRYN